jgi:hypothetical protein
MNPTVLVPSSLPPPPLFYLKLDLNDLKQSSFIKVASQLYCTIYHYEGSEKTGGLETE